MFIKNYLINNYKKLNINNYIIMQNSENNKKKKIPLYPIFKTTSTFKKNRENAIISDSSDDSNILEDSSDFETNKDNLIKKNKCQ